MQDLFRKHKRAILIFIIVVIGIPFVLFFGMPGGGGSQAPVFQDAPLANIGGVPIMASEYRRNIDMALQRQSRGDKRLTIQELDQSGEADRILQQMVDSALISLEEKKRGFDVSNAFIEERMKEWQDFKTEDGKFDAAAWNAWVQARKDQKMDWRGIYADMKDSLSRQVYMNMVMASAARVPAGKIEKELEENHTKIKIKYAKIAPQIEPSAEQMQAFYDGHQESYKTPDKVLVEFIAVPLQAPVPQKALDIVKQAREGADFAQLANEQSDLKGENGGDMGWQKPAENEAAHRKALFELPAGQVSDPIYAYGSYFIYKIEEERTDEASGKREVHARQIMIKAALTDEEKAARQEQAEGLAEKVRASKDLRAVAAEAGLEVKSTGSFAIDATEIENISRMDLQTFRKAFEDAATDSEYKVVSGRDSLYVTQVLQREAGAIPPFEDVRDKVREDTIADLKQQDDYKNKVKEYADKIKGQAKSLDEIAQAFPELKLEIKETAEPFTRKDYLYKEQLYLQPTQIFDEIGSGEPGAMSGPLQDFLGETYYVQLAEKTPPTEEDKKGWDEERKQLRETAINMATNDLLEDYRLDLRERLLPKVNTSIDQKLVDQVLGRGQDDAAKPEQPAPQNPQEALNRLNAIVGD
jgi:parvulin-like peptidyl-prolyl isomerase